MYKKENAMSNEIKYLKIKDNLFFNTMYVKEIDQQKIEPEPQNQFLIFDRSGSMYYYLEDLVNVAKEYCKNLPEGSTISLGYFSGRNQYNLSVPYTLTKELDSVNVTLDTFKEAIGLTCFNQILDKINEIADKVPGKSSLFFFTDGCHNSGGTRDDIENALKKWTNYAQVSMFVGYGWIDRDMMSFMASVSEGSFIHLNDFKQFKQSLVDFGLAVEDSIPTIPVEVLANETIFPVSFSGKSIIEYTVGSDRIVNFKPSKGGFKGFFFLTTSPINSAVEATKLDITMERGIRGLAYLHSQKNNVDTSLKLLSHLGDKYLIQKLYNSIAPEEFSNAEWEIRKSIFSPKFRYLEGYVPNFLPDPDAFCVLDAVGILAADDNVEMHISDKDFEYVKIGKSVEQQDGSDLELPYDIAVKFNNIVMNKERLNYSISTYTTGSVNLDPENFKENPFTKKDLELLGIPENFSVKVYRTYTIIADGRLQTKKLVVSNLSKETINKLSVIISRRNDGKYIVDFTTLPIINRTYVKMTSAKSLAYNVWKEKILTDQISLYNYYKKETETLLGKVSLKTSDLSEEAAQFLAKHCYIKNGSYNPPMKPVLENDEYEAYLFTININGFSKVTASPIVKKLDDGKKTTPRELIVKEAYEKYQKAFSQYTTLKPERKEDKTKAETLLDNLEKKIFDLNTELKEIRKNIQLSKFAIILGNKCKMDEFNSRENMVLTQNVFTLANEELSVTFNFDIKKTTIKI